MTRYDLPEIERSDFEQCSNSLKLDLISLLINFWYELGKIMNRYVFLDARFVILSNVWTDLQFTYFYFRSTYEYGQIMTRYDCKRPDEWFLAIFELTSTWPNFIFGQFSVAWKLILNGGAIRPIGLLFIKVCMRRILMISHIIMVFQFTSWNLTFGDIKRSTQGNWLFVGLYIVNYALWSVHYK